MYLPSEIQAELASWAKDDLVPGDLRDLLRTVTAEVPKKDTTQLNEDRHRAKALIPPGTCWQHKKGGMYRVDYFDIDADDGGLRVVYKRVDGPGFDAKAESSIFFSRRIEEWTPDRFKRL